MTSDTQPTVAFDPLDQSLRFADFPHYDRIREVGGIAWSEAHGGFWAVADHDLVRTIAADDRRFTSSEGVRIPPNGTPPTFALEFDRPRHTVHRRILTDAVGPRTAPALQERLRAEPDLVAVAVEETVRLHTPLRWFARTAQEDVPVGGTTVRAGERVMLLYAGANRDPASFAEPDAFRLDRPKANGHLAFGWGVHRCVGMPLAQLEIRVAVEELLARSDRVTPDGEITWTSSTEPRRIPVRLD